LLGAQSHDEPLSAPNLDVVAFYQALAFDYGLGIVTTDHRLKADKMAVVTNEISPVLCHPEVPCPTAASLNRTQNKFCTTPDSRLADVQKSE
jgi:hypothetical protein